MPGEEKTVLSGEELRTATLEDAERLTREFERDRFLVSQKIGGVWSPTRKMLENHMLYQMDDRDRIRKTFLFLGCVFLAHSLLILILFVLILRK